MLNDAGAAQALVSSMQSAPSGLLRIAAAGDFGSAFLSPVLGPFLARYPDITVTMELGEPTAGPIPEGFDVAVRVGALENSTLRARRLALTVPRLVASPAYLTRAGRPARIDDLDGHSLLHRSGRPGGATWTLVDPSGELRAVRTGGGLSVNDGPSLLNAAIAGLGIACLPSFLFWEAMDRGLVVDALPALPEVRQEIHAVYPAGRFTQPKVRAFIDFLVETFREQGPMRWDRPGLILPGLA